MSDVMLYEGEGVEVLGHYTAGAESCRYLLSNGHTLEVWYYNAPNYGREDMATLYPQPIGALTRSPFLPTPALKQKIFCSPGTARGMRLMKEVLPSL